jgi:hypothetical protein
MTLYLPAGPHADKVSEPIGPLSTVVKGPLRRLGQGWTRMSHSLVHYGHLEVSGCQVETTASCGAYKDSMTS